MRSVLAGSLLAVVGACAVPLGGAPPPGAPATLSPETSRTLQLTGVLTDKDLATYRELPFTVPPGVDSVTISLDHDGRDVLAGVGRTVIDLGLRDPAGFRGWSGSNKSTLFISANESTPSFRAGPVLPGTWTLLLGIPAIRAGVTTSYTATVTFNAPEPATEPGAEPGWLRGDFHAHTGHSDGSCANRDGVRFPCPVHETPEAAVRAGLDFVSVTDHNTFSQNAALRELEPFYPGLTLIRGAEITTFRGHANALGVRYPVDFQLGSPRLPTLDPLLDQVEAQGGVLSINHPGLPSGAACMGCGWTADTDWSRIAAIEVINGGSLRTGVHEGPTSGVLFWQRLLDQGHRITALGGSDNHDPTDDAGARQSPMGKPATVVWSMGRSEHAILNGVRSGRVFLDIDNRPGRVLDVDARYNGQVAPMGGVLRVPAGASSGFHVALAGVTLPDGSTPVIRTVSGGLDVMLPAALRREGPFATVQLKPGVQRGWIRVDVRDAADRLLMMSNPVYIMAE